MNERETDAAGVDVDHLLSSGTHDEIAAGIAVLIDSKNAIQVQLAHEKEDKSRPRGWRPRAVAAMTHMETELRLLKARQHELRTTPTTDKKPKKPGPKPERMAVHLCGGPDEIVEEVQCWLDEGWTVVNLVHIDSGDWLAVFRKDFEA